VITQYVRKRLRSFKRYPDESLPPPLFSVSPTPQLYRASCQLIRDFSSLPYFNVLVIFILVFQRLANSPRLSQQRSPNETEKPAAQNKFN
jgi:hypothetical protein